jgi:hypothetical protein
MSNNCTKYSNSSKNSKQFKKELKRRYLSGLNEPKPGEVLFCVEAVDYPEQEIPNSWARLAKCRQLNFIDSPYLKWNVYEDECGDVVVTARRVTPV